VVSPRAPLTDAEVEELLGAYVLDACEPDEVAAIEATLARRPDLARESRRLFQVAAWLGATEASEPPARLHASVVAAASERRRGPADPVIDAYLSFAERFERAALELPADASRGVTPNGLTAHDLVVHMAAQESLLAQNLGVPTIADLGDDDIETRTFALIPRFAERDVDDALDLWRASVEATRAWAVDHPDRTANWRGVAMTRNDVLLVRAFEAWIHGDDLRRAANVDVVAPPSRHVALMSDLAGRTLPLALALSGRARAGRTARLVLTGDGGGEWLIAMDGGEAAASPDVTLTADVLEWCHLVGDRIAVDELVREIEGDDALGRDLVAAAPALATL
jgi:uncharacterized protein (TIGR03083 family)